MEVLVSKDTLHLRKSIVDLSLNLLNLIKDVFIDSIIEDKVYFLYGDLYENCITDGDELEIQIGIGIISIKLIKVDRSNYGIPNPISGSEVIRLLNKEFYELL